MRLSASQIQTFLDCQRKWAWRYMEGIEEPPKPAAELGKAVHAALENYLLGGEIDFTTEVGYIAAAGLEHLPKPGTKGMLVEGASTREEGRQEFHFEGPSGHTYLGYKDLELPGTIYDHKTTSDLCWAKTEQELEEDIQATLYAVDYFRKNPEHPTVELRWVYYQTKNTKKSALVRVQVTQHDTWQRFLAIEKIAEVMHEVESIPVVDENGDDRPRRALDLPPTIKTCSAYGGCPHQGRCNLSPFEKMRSHVEQNKLTQLLRNKNGAAAAPAAPFVHPRSPQFVPSPAAERVPSAAFAPGGAHHGVLPQMPPAAAAPAATGNKLLARLHASGAPVAAVATQPAPGGPPQHVLVAINPPEYQPPLQAAPPAQPAAVAPQAAAPLPATPQQAAQELQESLSVPSAAIAATRGRGRPKAASVPATGIAPKIKILYVNCGPVGVDIADATQLISIAKKVIAESGLADYRFAEFGQGPGMLAIAVAAELDALEGMLPALRLDTTTPEGSIVAVELQARAELVVR